MDLHALLWLISLIHNRSHLCSIHTSQKISRFLKKSLDSFFSFLSFYSSIIVQLSGHPDGIENKEVIHFYVFSFFSPPSKIRFDEFEQFRNSWKAKRFFCNNLQMYRSRRSSPKKRDDVGKNHKDYLCAIDYKINRHED